MYIGNYTSPMDSMGKFWGEWNWISEDPMAIAIPNGR